MKDLNVSVANAIGLFALAGIAVLTVGSVTNVISDDVGHWILLAGTVILCASPIAGIAVALLKFAEEKDRQMVLTTLLLVAVIAIGAAVAVVFRRRNGGSSLRPSFQSRIAFSLRLYCCSAPSEPGS